MSRAQQMLFSERRWPHLLIRASAGTGKTFQLSNRFLDLLASGVPCDEILATTFTRKAAGEILDRILLRLAEAAGSDAKRQEFGQFIGRASLSRPECLALLAQTTRNLHRLRVSTLDSFFMAIAGSFSLELGLPSGWTIVEEVTDAALRAEAMRAALAQDATADLVTLVHLLTKGETTRSIARVVQEVVDKLHSLYLETDASAWKKLTARKGLSPEELAAVLDGIAAFPLAARQSAEARDEDVALARAEEWGELISKGLANKVLHGESTYYRKELPPELIGLYAQLLEHVRAEVVNPLVFQNDGAFQLLEKFDREYQRLKRMHGALRFDDVTRLVARSSRLARVERLGFRLDGGVRHLLLDEFQDTSLAQWQVLRGFAQAVTSSADDTSFFCVGDVKQAIYGWRGGLAQIFDALQQELTGLAGRQLSESFRSSPPVIETVNEVFANLLRHPNLDELEAGVRRWQDKFATHATRMVEAPGYACLRTMPEVPDGEDENAWHDRFVASYVLQRLEESPASGIGVIVRTNEAVRRIIFALRELGIDASEEGGNPLTDSAAVQLVLSLLKLADHPGDTVARFHVARSPLGIALEFKDHFDERRAAELAAGLRRRLLELGHGATILHFAKLIAPACNRREMSRLDQLVELAYRYEPHGSLRADAFVAAVEEQRVSDPTAAVVRVMNVHQCKGLEFDVVVLPELEGRLVGQPPAFVVGRPSPTGEVNAVCRYANENVRAFLPAEFQQMFADAAEERLAESLCVLYVALTRARHALHMLVEAQPAASPAPAKTFAGLLRASLANNQPFAADAVAFERGEANWFRRLPKGPPAARSAVATTEALTIAFATPDAARRRGWESVSPSQLEGGEKRRMTELFRADRSFGLQFGTLIHAWLAEIEWLEQGPPSDECLERISIRELGAGDARVQLKQFREYLAKPGLIPILSEAPYRRLSGLPATYSLSVLREHPFALRDGDKLMTGSVDRLVLQKQAGRIVAAEVIDFKTDELDNKPGTLADKIEYYRPQLAAYRRAVARQFRLDDARITARLVFLATGQVETV